MDAIRENIPIVFRDLMRNVGLKYRIDSIQDLMHADIYIEIFATMFPMLVPNIMKITKQKEYGKGERIQSLIEMLSTQILSLDLSHIRGIFKI